MSWSASGPAAWLTGRDLDPPWHAVSERAIAPHG